MGHRLWIVVLCVVAALGLGSPAEAGIKDKLKKPSKKKAELEQIASCVKSKAWIAYFKDDEEKLSPVRDTLNTENDDDWIGLQFSEYEGPRIRLGVLKVINKSAEAEENGGAGKIEVPVAGIQELLTVALYNTRRFDVIEQKRIHEVLAQHDRKDVIEHSPTSNINIGRALAAQYLVYGTVNEWNPERSNGSVGPGRLFKAGKKETEVAITFTLVDVGNGQILYTTSERARLSEWSFGFGAPDGGEGGTSQNTPVSYAVRACANKAALKIAMFLRDRKWRGTVVEISTGDNKKVAVKKSADVKKYQYFINAGSQQGMAPETLLSVQSVQGIIKDQNGMVLGENLRGIGTMKVISVQPGFSIARIVDGCNEIKEGDRVELATEPILPPPIPECDAMDRTKAP
jgi:curli biogenesis system outer membrane secretion channel CsgG